MNVHFAITPIFVFALALQAAFFAGAPPVGAQSGTGSSGEIEIALTAGGDGDSIGYRRYSHGQVDPDGLITSVFSGAIDFIGWDSDTETLSVRLTARPSTFLSRVTVVTGDPYGCDTTHGISYVCSYDADADDDGSELSAPWRQGDQRTLRLRFGDSSDTISNIASSGDNPAYGSHTRAKSIVLADDNDTHVQLAAGGDYLYVYDTNDDWVYVYNTVTQSRETNREFSVDDTDTALPPTNSGGSDYTGLFTQDFTYVNGYFWFVVSRSENSINPCLLYTSPSPRDRTRSRMPSSA